MQYLCLHDYLMVDGRPDVLAGSRLLHKGYEVHKYNFSTKSSLRIFGKLLFAYRVVSRILLVDHELASQIMTLNNVNNGMDFVSIYQRLLNSAKSQSKINDNRYGPLNGEFVRQDTVTYCAFLAKYMLSLQHPFFQ
jgi:hypothetical protein